jgi:glycerol uptake facilitator-like aquaporin
MQICGAIFGALLVAGLIPDVYVSMGDGAPGCFDNTVIGKGLTHSQLFGWEVVMTFTLISVVYACGVAKPGHGSFTPLVVGLSLVACAGTGGLLLLYVWARSMRYAVVHAVVACQRYRGAGCGLDS